MNDYIPNPANYTMKRNPPKNAPNPITEPEIDPTDVGAVRALVWDKLVRIAAVTPSNASALPILREIMDRIEGKPSQSVQLDATVRQVVVNATIRFADQPIVVEHDTTSGNGIQAIEGQR